MMGAVLTAALLAAACWWGAEWEALRLAVGGLSMLAVALVLALRPPGNREGP